MKICDFMNQLYDSIDSEPSHYTNTGDIFKIGDPQQEIRKIAVTMTATVPVLKAAAQWGANLMIVHEPTFYYPLEAPADIASRPEYVKELIAKKEKLIQECGMTIYRLHDHPHCHRPDMITEGLVRFGGLTGIWNKEDDRLSLEHPMSVKEIAEIFKQSLGANHIRVAGSWNTNVKSIALFPGQPGVFLIRKLDKSDLVVIGEFAEWCDGEFMRDLMDLTDTPKTLMVIGHTPSEQLGMKVIAEYICQHWPELSVQYFPGSEVFVPEPQI